VFHWFRSLFRRPASPAAFDAARGELLAHWFRTAAGAGKPKWLTWAGWEPAGEPLIVRDLALVPVVVRFEPVPGGPLEDVPQAREPRAVVAVFRWERGYWTTDGRAVFNLTPQQVASSAAPAARR
jgi:hypothetical protein